MWFRRNKDKAPAEQVYSAAYLASGQPRRHARQTPDPDGAHPAPAVAPLAEALILRTWLTEDLARMETAAGEREAAAEKKRAEAEQDLADAAHWRTVAAGIRRILDLAEATAQRGEQAHPEHEATAPEQPPTPPDAPEFAATWRVPDAVRDADCGCRWELGQSCQSCDALIPASILPWQPQPAADTTWWGSGASSRDGLTVTFPVADGETR